MEKNFYLAEGIDVFLSEQDENFRALNVLSSLKIVIKISSSQTGFQRLLLSS